MDLDRLLHPLSAAPPGTGTFPTFVSVQLIDTLALSAAVVVLIGVVFKYRAIGRLVPRNFLGHATATIGMSGTAGIFLSELMNRVILQRDVINKDNFRRFTHLAMFWGFVGLTATTTLDYIFNEPGDYIPLTGGHLSPIRWLGNLSGALLVLGATIAIVRLIAIPKFRRTRTFSDVWFTALLFLAGVTGFITQYFGDQAYAANPNVPPATAYSLSLSASPLIMLPYGIHLATIGLLLITAPVSAFFHALRVPSMRYIDRLGAVLSSKDPGSKTDYRKFKEATMMEELEERTEGE